ncbi:hypothetical protein [Streptomyces vilmorinianum]|uniref:hypothetical protein n=1 Tax=Streptomyces vilmorinianum TaxID=3051092 RepID=UPI0010FAFEEF|nr:hypothetical protein [Streptomyces vilmorinianum]
MTDKPSLRDYIDRYAAGEIPRDEALATIAAWDFEVVWYAPEPPGQDNTMAVINEARELGKLTIEDIHEILRRIARGGIRTDGKPSLRAYIERYAAGEIPRDEALATIAAWDFEEEWFDPMHTAPTHQDNTLAVVNQGWALGQLTDEDIEVIRSVLKQRGF